MLILQSFLGEFLHLVWMVLPFFILGVGFGALIETLVKPDTLISLLDRGLGPIVNGTILGIVLPGCACATLPMAEGLKSKGSSLPTVGAFVLSSPLLSPQTLVLNYALLGGAFTLWRVIFAFSGAILFGYLCAFIGRLGVHGFVFEASVAAPKAPESSSCCSGSSCSTSSKAPSKWKVFFKSCLHITRSLGGYFLVGMAIASLLTVLIPPSFIPTTVGSTGVMAFALALLVGIPLYVCEGEEIPMTLSLIGLGLGSGPAMTFLLGAVGTCIPTVIMSKKLIGFKAVTVYVIYWFVFATIAGLIFQWVAF